MNTIRLFELYMITRVTIEDVGLERLYDIWYIGKPIDRILDEEDEVLTRDANKNVGPNNTMGPALLPLAVAS